MALIIEARGLDTAEASAASVSSARGGRRGREAEALHILQALRGVQHESVDLAKLALDDLRDMLVIHVGKLSKGCTMGFELRNGVGMVCLEGNTLCLQVADATLRLLDLRVQVADLAGKQLHVRALQHLLDLRVRRVQGADLDVNLRERLVKCLAEILGDMRDLPRKLRDVGGAFMDHRQRVVGESALELFQLLNALAHCVPLAVELADELLHVGLQVRLVIGALEHDARFRRWKIRQIRRARQTCSQ